MSDKRSGTRTKSFLRGQIVFNNRMSTMDCIIRNISPTGAKLAVNEGLTLPDRFEISIPQKGETLAARIKWRRGEELGIVFVAAESGQDLADRVRVLEAENAELRKLLALMQETGGPAARPRAAG